MAGLINSANMKDKFMDIVRTMDISFSYKPVLFIASKTGG